MPYKYVNTLSDDQTKISPREAQIRNTLSDLCPRMVELALKQDVCEITVTFKQHYRDNFNNTEIHHMLYRYIKYMPLNGLYELFLIGEYGDNHNLHYHGIVRGTRNALSQVKIYLNRRFGRTSISTIRDIYSYVKYLMKEQPEGNPPEFSMYIYNKDILEHLQVHTCKSPKPDQSG